jgi:hypothetical protein
MTHPDIVGTINRRWKLLFYNVWQFILPVYYSCNGWNLHSVCISKNHCVHVADSVGCAPRVKITYHIDTQNIDTQHTIFCLATDFDNQFAHASVEPDIVGGWLSRITDHTQHPVIRLDTWKITAGLFWDNSWHTKNNTIYTLFNCIWDTCLYLQCVHESRTLSETTVIRPGRFLFQVGQAMCEWGTKPYL